MVDGGWCFLVSVFIFIFSDEIQTKWNLTIIVFDLFKEKYKDSINYKQQIINDDNLIDIIKVSNFAR